ncbi:MULTISPECIES: NAD(P)/FAD-dependent oxidoreductase [unclassified Haematobacter]|uniref:NAD(P)/FAD-dependent oxidoreductase n=1 Tax=unclassified Haematobacter TaxID=2640585 RepID=UPI0025BDFA8D|nr:MULTISPECIES: FAD-dependent oxidoreductase [unclassified Haematobacter]
MDDGQTERSPSTGGDGPTEHRPLHRDRPFWAATQHRKAPAAREPLSRHYDVIVIGSGISGALVAESLADGVRRVLILDRRDPVEGSTLASTAMIQHEIDVPLHVLARKIGAEKAARAWRRSARAVEDLRLRVERLGIDCAMTAKQALYLAGDEYGSRALQTETQTRHDAGIAAEYLNAATLQDRFGLSRTGAIVSDFSASANPAQMTAGLLRAALARGAELVSPVEVTDVEERGETVILATSEGRLLTAEHVVFCTGYEFLKVMESPAHRIISTWALASRPDMARPDWLDGFLVWEASDPYLYFRTASGGRIIVGGEDEESATAFADPAKGQKKTRRIVEKLADLTGIDIGEPAYAWAAPFGNTTTGLPIIDRAPGAERVHVVMGFGGNGITFSAIAADIVRGRVEGIEDPDADLFRQP